ncbi:translation initiation factor IF-2, partial [Planctomycetota bacterium]
AAEAKPEDEPVERPVYRMLDSVGAGARANQAKPATPPDLNIKHGARPRPGRPRRRKSPAARDRDRSRQNRRRRRDEARRPTPEPVVLTEFEVVAPISIREFSQISGIKAQSIIIKLLNEGMVSNINTIMDKDTIDYLAVEFERTITFKEVTNIEDDFLEIFNQIEDNKKDLIKRNPIVTFLGHVDHGKTSLLDSIREAGVVATESGGITQHTSAYIYSKDDKNITFIDTPGHAVFTEMRIRGAQVTDIVVLVVAADDGVMPQTREAYDHTVAAEVPVIVAMNKIDLPGADINRLKGQLAEMGLTTEDWGGSVQAAPVSAITGEGVDGLLELIMLEAEILDLNANPKRPAQAIVLETNLSDSRGIEATVVVKNGTLTKGDDFLCGKTYGRVRHMWDPNQKNVNAAGPSDPIVLTGFTDMPVMGDYLYVTNDQQQAKVIADKRTQSTHAAHIDKPHVSMANLLETLTRKGLQELNIIIKADTKGSVEAIIKGLMELGNKEVAMKVIHSGVGGINESDVMLADASDAIIIGFHVSPEMRVDVLADTKGVEIRRYHVIYEIFKEMEDALSGMLAPAQVESTLGRVEVRQTFVASSLGTIAGCFVLSGVIRKTALIRVLRNNIEIFDGTIASLKRIKDDAAEVKENFECGVRIAGFDDIKEGDEFEIYEINEVERTLSSITD